MDHPAVRRILIVEDDSSDFRRIREALRETDPDRFIVKHASRLEQARETLAVETFDIILLDVSLPDVEGLDEIGEIVDEVASIPVIVLGTQSDEDFGARAVRSGAQDYIVKRLLDGERLERAIAHAIARHQHQFLSRSQELRYQSLVEDTTELLAIADASGFLIYSNVELDNAPDYTYGGNARQSWFSLLHRDDEPRAREAWAQLMLQPDDTPEIEVRLAPDRHTWREHRIMLTNALRRPAVEGIIIRGRDVTRETDQQRLLTGLAGITRALVACTDLPAALQASLAIIEQALPVEEISILEYQDELLDDTPVVTQRFAWQRGGEIAGFNKAGMEPEEVDSRIVARLNELAAVESSDSATEIASRLFQAHPIAPENPVLLIPISLDESVSGVAVVKARSGHAWSDEESTALEAAVNIIGGAMARRDAATRGASFISRLGDILGIVRDGIVVFDPSGAVLYANPALQEVTGMQPVDFLQSNHLLLGTGPMRNLEQVIERPDGHQTTISIDVTRFTDEASETAGGVACVRENTSIQRAVQLLHGNEARLRAIVATAFEAIITTDDSSVIESFNPAAETMFGYAAGDVIGQRITLLIPELLLDARGEAPSPSVDARLLRAGGPVRELKAARADGSLFPIELSAREYVHRNRRMLIGSIRDITDRRAAEERIAYQIRQLESLRRIDRVLGSSLDLEVILDVVLDQLVLQPDIDAAAFRLFNDVTQNLELRGARGFDSAATLPQAVRLGEGMAGAAALERSISDLRDRSDAPKLAMLNVDIDRAPMAGVATPLVANGQLKGTLEIYRFRADVMTPGSRSFLGGLASQTAVAIDNTQLFVKLQRSNHQLERANEATLEGWARALEMRGVDTAGHSQRVSDLAVRLGSAMGIEGEQLKALRRGALLHDIGKIGVADAVLHKPGNLDEEDWAVIREVPNHANELLSSIPFLHSAIEIPYCHHEKWDGSGYPRGIREDTIPLAARVFSVVDVWDTLISDRPYRAARPRSEALDYIAAQAGRHFDPAVVRAFLEMMAEDELQLEATSIPHRSPTVEGGADAN